MSKKYSVIIPHYQDCETATKLIETIPVRDDIQIILIDDNSFETQQELFSLVDGINLRRKNSDGQICPVELFFNKRECQGAGGCRNIGLSVATGKWVIFADADDYFLPGAFDTIDENILAAGDDTDILYFSPTSLELPENKIGKRHVPYKVLVENFLDKPSREHELELRVNYLVPWSKVIRKSLIDQNELSFEDIRWSNDVMFSEKAGYFAGGIFASKKVIYCATRRKGTLTTRKTFESFKVRFDTYVRRYVFLNENLDRKDVKRIMLWPGVKIVGAILDGMGFKAVKYIFAEYKKNKISLMDVSLNDFSRMIVRVKMFVNDKKKYSK